jgi:hypothetical protein
MRDVVVVIPGILGSVLRQDGREVWGLSLAAGMHALTSLGGSLSRLALSEDSSDPEVDIDGVQAVSLLPDLHQIPYVWKIDGYTLLTKALVKHFRLQPGRNYFEFPYDWRRDNRVAARRLKLLSDDWLRDWRESSGYPPAKLIIVAHSMGGLVARYFLEVLGGWRDAKACFTVGTPYRGSVNALRTLIEGVRKGPFGILDLSSLPRSFTSMYQLLPTYPCVLTPTGKPLRVAESAGLPNVSYSKVQDAATFHNEMCAAVERNLKLEEYVKRRYRIVPVVGTHQNTYQSASLSEAGVVEFLPHHADRDLKGDGTVPRFSATPVEVGNSGLEVYAATCHASLQNAHEVVHHVCEAITGLDLDLTQPAYRFQPSSVFGVSLELEDAYWDDEPVRLAVSTDPLPSPALEAQVTDVSTGCVVARVNFPAGREGWAFAELPPQPPGVYRCVVEGYAGVHPVSDVFTVFDRRHAN